MPAPWSYVIGMTAVTWITCSAGITLGVWIGLRRKRKP